MPYSKLIVAALVGAAAQSARACNSDADCPGTCEWFLAPSRVCFARAIIHRSCQYKDFFYAHADTPPTFRPFQTA